jgi:hypothetical protein
VVYIAVVNIDEIAQVHVEVLISGNRIWVEASASAAGWIEEGFKTINRGTTVEVIALARAA